MEKQFRRMFRGRKWAQLLLVLPAAAALLISGGKKVLTPKLQYRYANDSVEVTPVVKPIVATKTPTTFSRAVGAVSPYRQQYGNEQFNSRLPGPVLPESYRIREEAALHETLAASFVLQDGNRIFTQGPEWRLFSMAGAQVASDRMALGYAVMDAPRQLVYLVDNNGYLAARNFSDGLLPFRFLPTFGNDYSRTFLSRKGRRMVVAGTERSMGAHGEIQAVQSTIESFDLGDPPVADSMTFLTSLQSTAALTLPTTNMQVAGLGERLVAAIPNHILLLNWDLKVEAAFQAEFEPQGLSLDEAGRIYVLARKGNRTQLWLLSPAGERIYSFDLHPGAIVKHPPIVGFDHTAYLIAGNQLIAVGSNGRVKWTKTANGRVAGASISTEDQLLVAEGAVVATYDRQGERRVVLTLPEPLATPPIVAETGEILVASARKLYRLEALRW